MKIALGSSIEPAKNEVKEPIFQRETIVESLVLPPAAAFAPFSSFDYWGYVEDSSETEKKLLGDASIQLHIG